MTGAAALLTLKRGLGDVAFHTECGKHDIVAARRGCEDRASNRIGGDERRCGWRRHLHSAVLSARSKEACRHALYRSDTCDCALAAASIRHVTFVCTTGSSFNVLRVFFGVHSAADWSMKGPEPSLRPPVIMAGIQTCQARSVHRSVLIFSVYYAAR